MVKIDFVTKARGFFRHLFSAKGIDATFSWRQENLYETHNRWSRLKSKVAKSSLLDHLGIIEVIHPKNKSCDIYGSFNRFVQGGKPYFIYVENPTALYHYRLKRNQTILGKRKIENCMNDPHLKALVFMSEACGNTFEKVCHPIPEGCISKVIYPYVPANPYVNEESISLRSQESIRLLYVAQGIRFYSKGALEIVDAYKQLRSLYGVQIQLTMVTNLDQISPSYIEELKREGIILSDFKLTFEQMQQLYAHSSILLHPSSDDSSPLTILEAMKAGLPIVSTRLYAIKEMVQEGVNGFLTDPHYWFFDKEDIPNPAVWNHREESIYAQSLSKEIAQFLFQKIQRLYTDRELLKNMSIASLKRAESAPFSETHIAAQWNDLLSKLNF